MNHLRQYLMLVIYFLVLSPELGAMQDSSMDEEEISEEFFEILCKSIDECRFSKKRLRKNDFWQTIKNHQQQFSELNNIISTFTNRNEKIQKRTLEAIGNKTLSIEKTMNELKEGKIDISDLPDAFFNYHSPENIPFRSAIDTGLTPLMWLVLRANDPYFYSLLNEPSLSKNLLETIDEKNDAGLTALMIAAFKSKTNNTEDIFKLLLNANANPNLQNNHGSTALTLAAEFGTEGSVKLLLEFKADINTRYKNNFTPLMYAVKYGTEGSVKLLLDAQANPNLRDLNNKTVLQQATEAGKKEVIMPLILFGANAKEALRGAKEDAKQILLKFYSDERILPNELWFFRLIRLRDNDALDYLFKHTPLDELRSLINQADNGIAPLDFALIAQNEYAISLLLSKGALPQGFLYALRLARVIPEWLKPSDNGKGPSLYEQIYKAYQSHYLLSFSPLNVSMGIPKDILLYIIEILLALQDSPSTVAASKLD